MKKLSVIIEENLLKEFKLACVRAGVDMSEVVIAAIENYLKSTKPQKKGNKMDTSIKKYEFKGLGEDWIFDGCNQYEAFLMLCRQVVGSIFDENGCLDQCATIEKYNLYCEEEGHEMGTESDMMLMG
jgi:hypothetical protein